MTQSEQRSQVKPFKFYLGTHQPGWLSEVPESLFVSRRRLAGRKSLPRAVADWALDSGGFTELSHFGSWTINAATYAEEVRRYRDEIGRLQWAAVQDWMCEPKVREKTRRTVREHQQRTVISYLELREIAPELPWLPVIQGWKPDDYLAHVDLYWFHGIRLTDLAIVGVGSLCRRQAMDEAGVIVRSLAQLGIKLHGFGFKKEGVRRFGDALASSDSLAWSFNARYDKNGALPGCSHKNCANCLRYAMQWRSELLGQNARRTAA